MIYLELFLTFLKIGAFTFGGGYAMLPLIQEEVSTRGWMDEKALIDFIAVSESTPGPFAVNISTYVGAEVGGVLGSVCATLGVVLPSFIIILIVAKCFVKFKNSQIIKGCMLGLKPAVVGMIAASVISLGKTAFAVSEITATPVTIIKTVFFSVLAFLAFKKIHPILIIGISAAAGILLGYLTL